MKGGLIVLTRWRRSSAQVSRILGHARPSITLDTYTHLFNHASHAATIRDRMANSNFGNLLEDAGTDGGCLPRLQLVGDIS